MNNKIYLTLSRTAKLITLTSAVLGRKCKVVIITNQKNDYYLA